MESSRAQRLPPTRCATRGNTGIGCPRWRREVSFPSRDASYVDSSVDGELFDVLARLTAAQRESVLLVHAYGWSYEQVADVLGIRVTAVRNHVHRGTAKLRRLLDDDSR